MVELRQFFRKSSHYYRSGGIFEIRKLDLSINPDFKGLSVSLLPEKGRRFSREDDLGVN